MAVKAQLRSLALFEIKGMAEALSSARQHQLITRENSLLNLTYDLCGVTVRTMTIRDYVLLERIGCPFLSRLEPDMESIAMFLWVLSEQFQKWADAAGWRGLVPTFQPVAAFVHARKIRRKFGKSIPETSEAVVVKAFEYIDTMFFDSPPALGNGQESCLSYLTGWFDAIQSEYKFSSEQVWSMGLPELFQRLNAIHLRKSSHVPQFNKGTDSIKLFILRGLRTKEFTLEDLAQGRVKIPLTFSTN